MGGRMNRARTYLLLLGAWIALIITLTSIPNPDFGPTFRGADKVAHFCFYGVAGFLCALWRRETGRGWRRAFAFAVAFVALLGAADEIHQYWIPGRSMDFYDWVADLTGGTLGAFASSAAVSVFPFLLTR